MIVFKYWDLDGDEETSSMIISRKWFISISDLIYQGSDSASRVGGPQIGLRSVFGLRLLPVVYELPRVR